MVHLDLWLHQKTGREPYLEGRKAADVLRDLGQLVGGQIQLHHAGPRAEVQRQRRQLVILQTIGKTETRQLLTLLKFK